MIDNLTYSIYQIVRFRHSGTPTMLVVSIIYDLNLKINNKILDILIKYYTFSHIIVVFIKISE